MESEGAGRERGLCGASCSLTWGLTSGILEASSLWFFAPENKEYFYGIGTDGPSRSQEWVARSCAGILRRRNLVMA